jgi:hypothetical protein
MLAWKIGRNCFIREINFWLRLVLLVAVNFEFFSMYNLLLTDEGYLHLRFVRIVEKDGRRDGRNQPLYFIGTELDYLRNMSKLDRDEQSEKIKKLVYLGLLISKVSLQTYLVAQQLHFFGLARLSISPTARVPSRHPPNKVRETT